MSSQVVTEKPPRPNNKKRSIGISNKNDNNSSSNDRETELKRIKLLQKMEKEHRKGIERKKREELESKLKRREEENDDENQDSSESDCGCHDYDDDCDDDDDDNSIGTTTTIKSNQEEVVEKQQQQREFYDGGDDDDDDNDGINNYANQMNIPPLKKSDKPNIPSHDGSSPPTKKGFRIFKDVDFPDDGSMVISYTDKDGRDKIVTFEGGNKNYSFNKLKAGKKSSGMVKGETMEHRYIHLINSMFFRITTPLVYASADDDQMYTSLKRNSIGCLAQIVDYFSKKHSSSVNHSENMYISCGVMLQGGNFRDENDQPIETLAPYVNKDLELLVTVDFTLFTRKSPRDGDVYVACKPKLTSGKIRQAVVSLPNF